jgi:uncharacterized repeat protein (TIGR03803 family)
LAGLTFDASGALYGTTSLGGASGNGTVFKLTPPTISGGAWTESVLHSFTGSDGDYPWAGLIFDGSGALYGTTTGGGASGNGTVFKLTPPTISGGAWTESGLHSFAGGTADGGGPRAGLIFDASGALYGTTDGGGAHGAGTVFKLTPPTISGGAWAESVLHSFTSDGNSPTAGLIFDASGALYGTTTGGGAYDNGAVFKLTPPTAAGGAWTKNVLWSFTGDSDGANPRAGLVFDASGALYGTTSGGGNPGNVFGYGTVFKLTPPTISGGAWTETVLYSFTGGSDGFNPAAGVIFDASGALYGTAAVGGGRCRCGTVFKLSGAGTPFSENPATSDFNADGYSDILWQNTSGEVAIWEMNGTSVIGGADLGNPGPGWHTIATGDFNGDGHADILWQNTSGEVAIWEMNGTNVIGGGSLGNPGASWHVIATGDFNGDGHSDILWQNTSGEAYIWEMNGTTQIGGGSLGNPGSSWHVIATGDFYANGHADILWQNTSGEAYIWEMNGTSVIGGGSLGNPGPSWHAIGTGDYYGNGYSDILWQNTSGDVYLGDERDQHDRRRQSRQPWIELAPDR